METNKIDKEKVKTYIDITRITIVICWIALLAFWAIKLFGGNFFEIVVQNENFVKFSDIVQNTWVKYIVSFFTISLANYLMIGAICQKFYFKGLQAIIVWLSIISMWAVSNFVPNTFFNMPIWYGYVVLLSIGIFYQKGYKKTFGIIAIICETAFSLISASIRNIPIAFMENYLIIFVFMFDLYIMTTLYYLYSNLNKLKKEIK